LLLKSWLPCKPALKRAIQVQFQLEDNELAAEPLPTRDKRRLILFYESAEGGAGVLKRLLDEPQAFARVAGHRIGESATFNRRVERTYTEHLNLRKTVKQACYDCLMNYSNQRDHALLDRKEIRDILLQFSQTQVVAAPAAKPRSEHLEHLMQRAESGLERQWLQYLESQGYRLPSKAQESIPSCKTRPDFLYEEDMTVVYVDGPHHLYPDRHQRDLLQEEELEDAGYMVVRFGIEADWASILQQYPHVFGVAQSRSPSPCCGYSRSVGRSD
jgi:very-short-patch-repair endonuclease